jgi:hypothetical protein
MHVIYIVKEVNTVCRWLQIRARYSKIQDFAYSLLQNDDFPDPLGPVIIHEKGCLNRKSWLMTDVTTSQRSFIYPKGTDELLASLRLLKKEFL